MIQVDTMYSIFYVLLPVILLLIYIFYKMTRRFFSISNFTSNASENIIFFTKDDVAVFLSQDKDRYVSNMSEIDFYARRVKNASEYIQNIVQCTQDLNELQQKKLRRCVKKADEFLANNIYKGILKCKDIAKIPWKFALTNKSGKMEYEEGLPHTREDIIFLSSYTINDAIAVDKNDEHLVSTLIHEKVHVFQRYYPLIVGNILIQLGYKHVDHVNTDLRRSNPDINDKVYTNAEGQILLTSYTSDRPSGINDVKNSNHAMEHPYEMMAYDIANEYTKQNLIRMMVHL